MAENGRNKKDEKVDWTFNPPLKLVDSKKRTTRFKITMDELPSDWETIILDSAQEGKGISRWCVLLGIHSDTFRKFSREDEHFKEVFEMAKMLEQCWWEDAGQLMVTTGKGSQSTYALIMKQKYGWQGNVVIKKYNEGYLRTVELGSEGDFEDEDLNIELSQEKLMEELSKRGLPTTMFKKQSEKDAIDGTVINKA